MTGSSLSAGRWCLPPTRCMTTSQDQSLPLGSLDSDPTPNCCSQPGLVFASAQGTAYKAQVSLNTKEAQLQVPRRRIHSTVGGLVKCRQAKMIETYVLAYVILGANQVLHLGFEHFVGPLEFLFGFQGLLKGPRQGQGLGFLLPGFCLRSVPFVCIFGRDVFLLGQQLQYNRRPRGN